MYASGELQVIKQCIPVMEGFARSHQYLGQFGAGTKMKLVANLLVAIHNQAAVEAFVLGMKAGLDPELILQVIPKGGANSRVFEIRSPLMASSQYEPPFMKMDD